MITPTVNVWNWKLAKDLPENPSSLQKAKYELCQKILSYQEDNNLSDELLAKKLGLSKEQTLQILFGKLSLNRRMSELFKFLREEEADKELSQATKEIATHSDLIIQPVGASNDDLMPAVKEFNALKKAGIPPKKLLFALARLSTLKEAEAIKEYLKDTDYKYSENYLLEKTSYKQIQNEGKSITE
ncbi:16063_t:CDS:2, partial [Racocetra persica]